MPVDLPRGALRHSWSLLLLAAAMWCAHVATAPVATSAAPDSDAPLAVTVEGVSFRRHPSFSAYIGGRVSGTVTVTIKNWTAQTFDDVLPVVTAGGEDVFAPSIAIEPFAVVQATAEVELDAPSWTTKRIEVSVLGATGVTEHRTLPWVSLALVALLANTVLLTCRDALRDAVRRRVGAVRRRTTRPGQ